MRLWLKLDSGYYLDPKLRKVGADARLCWAPILALMKQHGGLIPDDELDAEYLADQVGGDAEMWDRAISRLKDLDLLVLTTQSRHRGRGVYADVSGWTAPNWVRFQSSAGEKRPTETTTNGVKQHSTALNGVKRSETALNALSREKRLEETREEEIFLSPTEIVAPPRSKRFSSDSEPWLLAVRLRQRILDITPDSTAGNTEARLQAWCKDVDRMIRIDKRQPAEIAEVIDWAHGVSDFWGPNIRSAKKLRDKFEQMRSQMRRPSAETEDEKWARIEREEIAKLAAKGMR